VWRILKKLKIKLPCDSTVPVLDIFLKESKAVNSRDTHIPMFIVALFRIVKLSVSIGAHQWMNG
jgi:hypothetical protein